MHALIALIYKKHSRISNATNKKFGSGEVVNFISVDAERIYWLCFQLASVAQVPFVFMLGFALLFYEFGISFLVGLGVFVIMVLVNLGIGAYFEYIEKKIMK